MKRLLVSADASRCAVLMAGVRRRGTFVVLAFFCLMAAMAFVTFSIDTGNIALHKTLMQNGVDTAALAAAMEITHAVENAPLGEEDPTAWAREQARTMAAEVAGLNGIFVDPNLDVTFGLRSYNAATGQFEIQWGIEPSNAVKVKARRDNDDTSAPDGKLPLIFAGVLGDDNVQMRAEAIAYIESRDIAVVLDFSGSMRYDSLFRTESVSKLGVDAIRDNLRQMYWELELADGTLGTLDHSDPENPASSRDAEVKWLVVHSPDTGDPEEPNVDVTFQNHQASVESDQEYTQVKLEFTNGASQAFTSAATSGTYAGTGWNSGRNIRTVWVMFPGPDVTIEGDDPLGCRPHIDVTFFGEGTSVYVESTKDLSNVVLEFDDGTHDKFDNLNQGPNGTFAGIGENAGKQIVGVWVKSGCNASGDGPGYGERFLSPIDSSSTVAIRFDDSNANVEAYFGLDGVTYPYPSGSWDEYVNYVRNDAEIDRGGHREMFGGITFVHYLLEQQSAHNQTAALARTSHFPFHAVREGNELFVDFLETLGFGDHVGLVSYDQYRRTEEVLNEDGQSINLSGDPIGDHYAAIKTIMDYKQASHYYARTNIGGGIRQARAMLNSYGREGARPTLLLMTDGNANVYENAAGQNHLQSGFSNDGFYQLPPGFDWSLVQYPGSSSFSISDNGSEEARSRIYALSQAYQAVQDGITVHTLAVGADADRELMQAIAWLGGGEYISVEGDLSVENLIDEIQAGFFRIAALVPPARLANPDESTE